jgi:hypothetical protein
LPGLRLSPTRARRVRTLATACGCLGPLLLLLGAAGFASTWVIQAFAESSNLQPFTVNRVFLLGDAAVLVLAVVLMGLWGMLTYALEHGRTRER